MATEQLERITDAEAFTDYQRRGWVKLTEVLSPAQIERMREIVHEASDRPEFKPAQAGSQADQGSREYEHTMRVLRRLWTEYPEVEQIAREVGGAVRALTGWDGVRLWSDRIFIKPGSEFGSAPTFWHQDLSKLPFDRRGFATVWIALHEIPKTRGPLTFLDGSHRLGLLGAVSQIGTEADLSELLQEVDWEVVSGCSTGAPLAAGDATVHAGMTLHRAGANRDREDRVVLAISYFQADALYTGAPSPLSDHLGMTPYEPFDHERFPIVA